MNTQIFLLGVLILLLTTLSGGKRIIRLLELANYQIPENSNSEKYHTIAILGTNDIHGAAFEKIEHYNGKEYHVGGYKLLSGVIDIYRKKFNNTFLWLDAGDQFQGTYEN